MQPTLLRHLVRPLQRRAVGLIPWTVVAAFVLIALGPLVDHHFMERVPAHGHIHALVAGSIAVPPHVHGHQDPSHDHGPAETSSTGTNAVGIVPADRTAFQDVVVTFTLVAVALVLLVLYSSPRLLTAASVTPVAAPAGGPLRPPPRSR